MEVSAGCILGGAECESIQAYARNKLVKAECLRGNAKSLNKGIDFVSDPIICEKNGEQRSEEP